MAKKKVDAQPDGATKGQSGANQRGRPKSAEPKPVTPVFMTIRANEKWQAWYGKLSAKLREKKGLGEIKIDRTDAFDMTMAMVAQVLEIEAPPSRY
jgi:hypothetical protein